MGVVEEPLVTPRCGKTHAKWLLTSALMLVPLGGCSAFGGFVASELSRYAEPVDGPLAHIRLIGSRNVKLYPNSDCVSIAVPGGGYPAGPQLGGQRKRDLGMPKTDDVPGHYVEAAARAGEPITAAFSFYAESYSPGVAGTGAPGTRRSASCFAAGSFVPEDGGNYEVSAKWRADGCDVRVMRLVTS